MTDQFKKFKKNLDDQKNQISDTGNTWIYNYKTII